jgi:hypothetical protein
MTSQYTVSASNKVCSDSRKRTIPSEKPLNVKSEPIFPSRNIVRELEEIIKRQNLGSD